MYKRKEASQCWLDYLFIHHFFYWKQWCIGDLYKSLIMGHGQKLRYHILVNVKYVLAFHLFPFMTSVSLLSNRPLGSVFWSLSNGPSYRFEPFLNSSIHWMHDLESIQISSLVLLSLNSVIGAMFLLVIKITPQISNLLDGILKLFVYKNCLSIRV